MKRLLLLVVVLFSVIAIGQSVRSSIGARSMLNGGNEEGWSNPYVTDGLIAMWDGEWNAGGGVHDASASVWIDLIGGKTINLPSSTQILNDKMTFVETAKSSTIEYDTSNPIYSVFHTFKKRNINQTSQAIFMLLSEGTSSSVGAYSWNANTPLRAFRGVNWQKVDAQDYEAPCQIGIVYSTANDSSSPGNKFSIYFNGVKIYELTGASWIFGYWFATTGSYKIYGASDGPQDVYNIRLYNRDLSDIEIAINYAIDKARFNLP